MKFFHSEIKTVQCPKAIEHMSVRVRIAATIIHVSRENQKKKNLRGEGLFLSFLRYRMPSKNQKVHTISKKKSAI
jgi:hypothetical protein